MNFRSITLPQALVLIACLAATVCTYKFVSPDAANITGIVGMIISFMLGRGAPPPSGDGTAPNLKVIAGGAAALLFIIVCAAGPVLACAGVLAAADDAQIQDLGGQLADCRALGRQAGLDGGTVAGEAAYEACKKEAGVQ